MTRRPRYPVPGHPLLIALCLLLTLSPVALAQSKPDFFELQRTLSQLKDSPAGKNDRDKVESIGKLVNEFQRYLQETPIGSDEDAGAVAHLAGLLALAARQPDKSSADPILSDINLDLKLKNSFYSQRMGLSKVSRGEVKVTVRTLSGDQPVKGLIVFCNPYRWANAAQPMKTFPALSTPTDTTMLPGYYRCAATLTQGGTPAGDRTIEIGLDGQDSVTVDIPVKP